jgi:hypothetical protein
VIRNRFGKMLDEGAELAELDRDRLGRSDCLVHCRLRIALDRGEAPVDLGHGAADLEGATWIAEMPREIGIIARAARRQIVEREAAQHRDGHDGGLGAAQAEPQVKHGSDRAGDQDHADGHEDGTQTSHPHLHAAILPHGGQYM